MDDFLKNIKALAFFAGHTVFAIALFSVIGAGVIGLHQLQLAMVVYGMEGWYTWVMKALEAVLFIADVLMFCLWLSASIKTCIDTILGE